MRGMAVVVQEGLKEGLEEGSWLINGLGIDARLSHVGGVNWRNLSHLD